MDSMPPLPKLLDMDLKITVVECHSQEALVKFHGQYNAELEFDYHILQNEIQHVPKVKDNIGINEFCLVEDKDSMQWHRGRILDKKEELYEVFLIDTGNIVKVGAIQVASACGEMFQLPPRIVCGIFSNILPIEEKWSAKAINYFSSLVGIHVKGYVQANLPSHVVLLEVPKVTNDVIELKLSRYVDGATFNLIVEMLKEFPPSPYYKHMPDLLQQNCSQPEFTENLSSFKTVVDHLRPCLSVGTAQKVKITSAVSPSLFYCRIFKWIQELEQLTSAMSLHYEAVNSEKACDHFGLLCAAKRKDGQWHRGVFQQLLSSDKVKVWFMDFGNSEAVPSASVHKLQPEFLLLPMMSIPCSLSCLNKPDEKHRKNQLRELKEALLGQTVLVHIDFFSMEQRLYYVTLHNQDFICSKVQQENQLIPLFSPNGHTKIFSKGEENEMGSGKPASLQKVTAQEPGRDCTPKKTCPLKMSCTPVEMKMDSVYVAFVQYVLNPSNFWIQTDDQQTDFAAMMKNITEKYAMCEAYDMLLEYPEPGVLCCARYSKDMHFYRAVVSEVHDLEITVYFIDFGNTETIPCVDVKQLLAEFCELPAAAVCCTLAHAFPLEDVWIKSATDFFKTTVFGKPLLVRVLGKQNEKYVVDIHQRDTAEESNVVTLMVQAGYAEYWGSAPDHSHASKAENNKVPELKKELKTPRQNTFVQNSKMITNTENRRKPLETFPVSREVCTTLPSWESTVSKKMLMLETSEPVFHYSQHVFKPGTVIDVRCSHVCSPGDFWCQVQSKSAALGSLMRQIQNQYRILGEPYQIGQTACIAKRLVDGKWYRASVVQQVSSHEVDVMFVDYGFRERVKVVDVKTITPDFLLLEGQAFRCSLYNLIEPINADPISWTKPACSDFRRFIDSAGIGSLKCTIYAMLLMGPTVLCNVVNLETPFRSAKQFLIDSGHAQSFKLNRRLVPPISLCTFMYSSFNIQLGSEEEMYITHIYNPTKFYCQLTRNSEMVDALMTRAAEIANTVNSSENCKLRLCIAKYFEDGNFYRATAYPIQSSSYLMVYFVDFGNKQIVEKHQLLPIPDEATDLLFTPAQALKCYLSGVTETVLPTEVGKWFENNCLGKPLKATVVSKEMDGRLSVELFDGSLPINQKIKELLKVHAKDCGEPLESTCVQSIYEVTSVKQVALQDMNLEMTVSEDDRKSLANNLSHFTVEAFENAKESNVIVDPQVNTPMSVGKKVADEMFSNILQNLDSNDFGINVVSSTDELCTRKIVTDAQQEKGSITRPKYINLPQPNVKPNSERLGYVSHINSQSSFYIQLAEDEHMLLELVEELNAQSVSLLHFSKVHKFTTGDIVVAEYTNDGALYRAVIKQLQVDTLFDIEFIDYGNSAIVCRSKMYQLPVKFLNTPRLAIHAFLSGMKNANPGKMCSMENAPYFSEKLLLNGEPILFEFIQEHKHQWEVTINANEMSVGKEFTMCQGQKIMFGNMGNDIEHDQNKNVDLQQGKSKLLKGCYDDGTVIGPTWPNICDNDNLTKERKTNLSPVPYPTVHAGQLEKVKLLHISDSGTFYVTLSESSKELSHLSVLIDNAVEQNSDSLPLENIEEGMMCLTKSERNLKWLRSEVKEIFPNEKKMLVFFVDHGTTEKVSMRNAKILHVNIKCIPKQTVTCKWVWFTKAGKQFVSVMNSLSQQVVKILFLQYLEPVSAWEVEILIDDLLLMQYSDASASTIKKNEPPCLESIYRGDSSSTVALFPIYSVQWIKRDSCKLYNGFASAATDPSNFFMQLEDSFDTMVELCMLLCDLPDNISQLPLEHVIPGSHCLMKYDLKEQWCRAEVLEVSSDCVSLIFIDFGTSLKIPYLDIDKLKIIPEEIAGLPRLAYPCTLSEVTPVDLEKWTQEAILFFLNYLNEKELLIQFKNYQHGIKLEVDILHKKSNLVDELVAAGYAVRSARKTPDLQTPVYTKPIDKRRKPVKITRSTKNVAKLSTLKGGCKVASKSQNYKMDLPQQGNNSHLNAVLRDETGVYNYKEDGSINETVNAPQQSNIEYIQDSIQVSLFCATYEAAERITRTTMKTGEQLRLKDHSNCKSSEVWK